MGSLWMASMRRIAELEAERDAAVQRAAAAVADRERERQAIEAAKAERDASAVAAATAACATQPHKVSLVTRPASAKGRRRRQRSA
jgi:Tfp pilus assembly protein PilX